MAGQQVPLVLLPRYTTFAGVPSTGAGTIGVDYFSTIAMDVTQYQSAVLNVWRGKIIGSGTTPKFNFQESTDQVNWSQCAGVSADRDPGENKEAQYEAALGKRWFRITVKLDNQSDVLSCWAVGFLVQRLS
jgi:hypothetical protein